VTFSRSLDGYFNGCDGYQPPLTPVTITERQPLTRSIGYQARSVRRAKFTAEELATMRRLRASGQTVEQIAAVLGAVPATVQKRLRQA
jgi:DNA-binding NarL/FixJ family response regulator